MDSKVAAVMIKPTIGLDVQSWSYDKFMASSSSHDIRDGAKVTLIEIHPVRPWVLSCDKDGEIFLWNFDTNTLLMRKTLHEMYATVGREDSAILTSDHSCGDDAALFGLKNVRGTSASSGNNRAQNGVNGTNVNRMQMNKSRGFKPSSVSQDILNMSLAMSANQAPHTNSNDHRNTRKNKDNKLTFGVVRQLGFADRLAISHLCSIKTCASISVDDDTFNSDSHIMVVCDLAVILYDFILDTAVTLSVEKSDTSKSPKCATFLYKNIIAVGFGDGQIRVWSLQSNNFTGRKIKELTGLQGHHKEIVLLKILQVPETSRNEMDATSTVRLLSVCMDGNALIWDFQVTSGELDMKHLLSNSSPAARLQENVGALTQGSAGSGTGSMMLLDAFMDCDTSTLLTVTGDRSFKLWDIGVLSHHQNSNDNHSNSANNDSSSSVINTVSSRSPAPTSTHSDDRKKSSFFKFSSSKKGKSESSHSRSHKEIPVPSVLSGVCLIPCVGRIVQGSSLPPSLMKFVSCCILNHPRFPFGTFAIVSKSNSIGIVQATDGVATSETLTTTQGDRSSVSSTFQEKPQRFQVLHEISLGVLMHSFLSRSNSAGLPPSHSAILTLAALDGGAKIYCVRSHPTQPHLLAIGTSIGSMVLSLLPSQSGPFIGTHPLWGDMTLTYGDRILRQALVSMTFENQFESDTVVVSKNSTDIADTKEGISTGEGTGIGIGEKERNYREISLGDASVDVELLQEYPLLCSENNTLLSSSTVESTKGTPKLGRLFSRTKSFTTEQDKEKKFNLGFKMGFGSKKGGQSVVEEGLRSATPIATSSSSRNKSRYVVSGGITYPVDTRFPPNVVCPQLNISTSRPLFYPSPSGEYCAVFWPESSFYLLFKVKVVRKSKTHGKKKEGAGGGKNRHQSMLSIDEGELEDEHTHDLKNFNSEKERVDSAESDSFIEVDKGRGISFGWIGMGSTYAVLEPGYRLETIDQKRSGIFSKNEKEIGLFVSPQLVIKVISSSNTIAGTVGSHDEATTSIPSTGPTSFPIIVDMSALDVVNTTSTSSSSASILPQELFGGMLICISTPLRSTVYNKDPKSAHSAQKSISKIEADALAQQQINSKKEQIEKDRAEVGGKMSRSSAASVESIVSASAASWEDSAGGGGEYFRATQKSRFYILSSSSSSASNNISRLDIPQTSTALTTPAASAGSSPDPGLDCVKTFALKPVGPSLSGVRCVTWDLTSGLCVVLIGSTVNILKLEVEKQDEVVKRDEAVELGQGHRDNTKRAGELGSSSTVALSMFASIDLLAYTCSYSSITSSSLILPSATFMWKNGQLFVLTSTELLLLFSDYPFIEQHTNEKSTVSREKDQRVDAIYPRLNVLIVASTSADASASSMDGTLRSMNAYIDRDKGKEKVQSRDTTGKDPERNWERDRNQESIGTFNTVQPLKSSHGHLDILGCRRGHILLSSRDGAFSAISLNANPLVAIGCLLSLPQSTTPLPVALAWTAPVHLVPLGMASTAAEMLLDRGLKGACSTMLHGEPADRCRERT